MTKTHKAPESKGCYFYIGATSNLMYYNIKNSNGKRILMTRTFIEVPMFTKKWHSLGLTDNNLKDLQNELLKNPKSGRCNKGNWWFKENSHPYGE